MGVWSVVLYLLNTLIVPFKDNEAKFQIRRVSPEEAKNILKGAGQIISAVGHKATADLMSILLGVQVSTNRISIYFQPGDQAIAFVLKQRLQEGQVINSIDELEKIGYDLFYVIRIQ